MIRFLAWVRAILMSVVNTLARAAVLLLIVLGVLFVIGLARGDGLPGTMVVTMDLREALPDSAASPTSVFTPRRLTVMGLVLGLEAAGKDARVKGAVMQLGNGAISTAQAQEIAAAVRRFRDQGKFVIAQATAFRGSGLGDYLAASAADEIWIQPKADFSVSGAGGGSLFLRGLFDKIAAEPQIAKRAEYKSAADTFMETKMSDADREQQVRLLNTVYDGAVDQMATARKLNKAQVIAALEASPQFSEDARSHKLVDRLGYDDEARSAALRRAGEGARTVKLGDYAREISGGMRRANIALVVAAGEIRDGTDKGSLWSGATGIASDDLSAAIRQAAADKAIKAIVLRVDSPGGSVTASDQILHAVKAAQRAGKPVVVSMGSVAASGGYYIATSANRIVAAPATITGSIGVLTGKVSVGKSIEKLGVHAELVGVGKNTLMNTPFQPYTPEQWANLNRQADVIYQDFVGKVAAGRKLPVAQAEAVAKGRVWSGADARANGLVDLLGGFWTAAGEAARLGHVPAGEMVFRTYPARRGILASLAWLRDGMDAGLGSLARFESLMDLPAVEAVSGQMSRLPRGGVELRATHLPQP